MPRRRRRQEEDLIQAATEALEQEISCWQERPERHYGQRDPMVRLVRYPRYELTDGPSGIDAMSETAIETMDLPQKEVPYFLRYRGMQAAIQKIRELEA